MTDPTPLDEVAQFEAVLEELRGVLSDFTAIGVTAILVGGQVLAVEGKAAGGDGVIEVRTPTDVVVRRGFSMEPDLLFDVDEAAARADAIVFVLKQRGFRRATTYRWAKPTATGDVLLDLFMSPDADEANNPAGFTRLPAGDVALLRPRNLRVQLKGACSTSLSRARSAAGGVTRVPAPPDPRHLLLGPHVNLGHGAEIFQPRDDFFGFGRAHLEA